ncbi:GNAT family N-acetyltransferase [Dermabacteraceae bacterium P13088]
MALPKREMMSEIAGPVRPLRAEDAEAVLAAFVADAAEMSRQGTVRDLTEARAYVARLLQDDNYAWAIVADDCNADEAVGMVAFSVDEENRNAWFFYWLDRRYRGRGLTSRAARAVADWALSTGGLHRLELGHRANNPASGGVARAAGFAQEGVEREKFLVNGERMDVYTYGRLASD